jgi:hypothetical protein
MKEYTGYWTFFCNPKRWYIDDFILSGETLDTFSISEYHKHLFERGQYGVIRVGRDSRTLRQLAGKPRLDRGIYAIVEVLDTAQLQKSTKKDYWEDEGDRDEIRLRVKIRYIKRLLNNPILLEYLHLTEEEYDYHLINGQQGSTMPLNPLAFNKIIEMIGGWDSLEFGEDTHTFPEEISEDEPILEGAKKQITVNAYERNPLARKRCLEQYGYNCSVCNFNFSDIYGDIGIDFIHVHHLKELNQIGEEYEVDPVNDLRPVCPNCHAMLHKRKPVYSIEELKAKINFS